MKLVQLTMWLEYWCCFSIIWSLKSLLYPNCWPSILLLSSGYLQHVYFKGCVFIMEIIYCILSPLPKNLLAIEDIHHTVTNGNNTNTNNHKQLKVD